MAITRRAAFCASHRYENAEWSPRKNREVFGACYNSHGHGHNYELEVTVRGPIDPQTGMVLNLKDVDAVLQEEVVARYDHRHINEEVDGFEARNPTVENISLDIWERLAPRFEKLGVELHRVRLYESPTLYAEYRGESS